MEIVSSAFGFSKQSLLESEERLNILTQATFEAIFILENHHVADVNDQVLRLFGYRINEVIGKHVEDFVSADSRELVKNNIDSEAENSYEFSALRKDGSTFQALGRGKTVTQGGKSIRISVVRDLTERRRTEDELRKTLRELQRSNQELERFAYIASHDLQEPLRKIQAFGNRLSTSYEHLLDEKGRDYLRRMLSASCRAQSLISDLLKFSRLSSSVKPFIKIDLNHLVAQVIVDLDFLIQEKNTVLNIEKLPEIEADSTQMRQLFYNLIHNSLKFSRDDANCRITIGSEPSEGGYKIWVKDTGIGFEEQYVDKIFTIFQRLHSRQEYEGTGIGLAICKKIVERHNGTIQANSKPGEGATFTVTVPAVQPFMEALQFGEPEFSEV